MSGFSYFLGLFQVIMVNPEWKTSFSPEAGGVPMVPPAPPPPPREDHGGPLHELHWIRVREFLHACHVDHDCFQRSNLRETKGDETNRHCGHDDIKEWELDHWMWKNHRTTLELESMRCKTEKICWWSKSWRLHPRNLTNWYQKWPCSKGVAFSKAHHFGYPAVSFRQVRCQEKVILQPDLRTIKHLSEESGWHTWTRHVTREMQLPVKIILFVLVKFCDLWWCISICTENFQ